MRRDHETTKSARNFEEPFQRTLLRNITIALGVAVAFTLAAGRWQLLLPRALLASWFSLGGHYVEIGFLNHLRPRLPPGRAIHLVARMLVWFGGGVLLYVAMATTALALPLNAPSLTLWWHGGLLFIGVELVVHAVLAMRGLPNFYNGMR